MPSEGINEQFSKRIKYDRLTLHNIGGLASGKCHKPNGTVMHKIKQLGIQRNKRGKRGGRCHNNIRAWDINQGVNGDNLRTLPQAIPTVCNSHRVSNHNSNTTNLKNIIEIKPQLDKTTNGRKNMKICSINPRSVKNKTVAISDFITSDDFDIIAITETWLNNSVDKTCSSELVPNGYRMKQVPRPGKTRGGGVAIIYKNSIDFKLISSSSDSQFTTFEHIDCNISINKYSMRLSVIYRPPPSTKNGLSTQTFLEHDWPQFLSNCATIDKPFVIVGDLNFHLDKPNDSHTCKFNSCLEAFGLKQHVHEQTHVAGHTLDVIITRDNDNIVSNIEIKDPGLSDSSGKLLRDHFAVMFNTHADKPPPIKKTVSFRKLKSIDINAFRNDVKSLEILQTDIPISDLDKEIESLNSSLTSLIDKHAPLITKTIVLRPTNQWYNEDLHKEKHLKRKLERKWRKTKLTIDYELYRNQCALLNKLLKDTRIKFYSEKINSCGRDQKTLFQVTKTLLGKKEEIVLPNVSSAEELAQQFSDFFINKIDTIRDKISSEPVSKTTTTNIDDIRDIEELVEFTPVTPAEVRKIITKSQSKSCELDPIPTWLLKECLDELLPFLTKVINYSMENASVPKSFKSSLIRPLIKKSGLDENTLKNYRPVSNLTFVSKILEKIVDSRLESHLSTKHLHEVNQSAYRKFHSTETALIKVQNDILNSLDNDDATILVMLDLSAAFDTIDHQTLLQRLKQNFGISGKPLKWIHSYLSDRYQTVTIDNKLSKPVKMNYSVPQGSVLGPKFFTMYTKPVGSICTKHGLNHHYYADDGQLYLSFKPKSVADKTEALQRIENCLSEIVTWMNINMLKINADKTELIVFTSQKNEKHVQSVTVNISDENIKQSKNVRNLGAFFDSNMTMEKHISSVCKSCYGQLRQIGHIRKYLDTDGTKSLVNSLVTSRMDYCNALLSGVPLKLLNQLQHLQNTAARVISRTSRYDHITPILKELHWLPVPKRVEFKTLVHTFKALHDQSPKYLKDLLEIHQPKRTLRSSNSIQLVVPKQRTARFGERSFSSAAPKLWNATPSDIRDSKTVDVFKRSLKTHFFKLAYGN